MATNKFNVVESTNMKAVRYAERILDAVCPTEDIENGTFGYLQGTDDIKTFVKGVKAGEQIVMVNAPAWTEDMVNGRLRSDVRRDKFVNKAGIPFRVFVVAKGDTFATAIEGVTPATQDKMLKDAFVTIDATTGKLVVKATTTADAPFEAVVEKVRLHGGTIVTDVRTYGYSTKMYECTVKKLS